MDNHKMDEGAITRSLLKEELSDDNEEFTDSDQIGMQPSESSSPTTFLVVFSTLVAVFGSFVFGTAIGYSSPAQSGIVSDLELSTAEYSVFGSILNIGAMLGALLSGRVADLVGRRGAMGFSEILCIIGWLAISFAKDAIWLDFGRFAVGNGVGLLSYVVPVYIAEITPKNLRGAFMSLNQLMLAFGKGLTFIIGALVTWRTLAIIGIIPCLAQLLGVFFIPESPRWLAKVGRMQEFESTLQHLRGKGADISQEAADIKDYTAYLHRVSEDGIFSLFEGKYMHSIIIGVGLMLFQQFGGLNGVNFYASNIFISAGFSGTTGTITAAVVQIIMVMLGVMLIDKFGRRPLLLISEVGTCLGCTIAGLSFFFQDLHLGKEVTPVLVLLGVLVYLGFVEIGMAGIPWIIMSEIFPMNVKGSAGSLVGLVNWVSSWVVAYTFNFLYEWSSVGTFLIYAAICGTGVLFIAKLVPETKGRKLEEIQASMTSGLLH